jgi:DNA-binding NarL/FixJ family response regulator
MTLTVIIADDQGLIRAGFASIINSDPELEVVALAQDGHETIELVREHQPDVVLMDIRMPGMDGLTATELLSRDPEFADIHILVLTTFDADDYVVAALRAGASGFLGKDVEPADLIRAIKTVAAGNALLSPVATRSLIQRYLAVPNVDQAAPHDERLAQLTEREREILVLVSSGLSNDDIAGQLVLSPLTVKTHVNRAMTKLDARDRAQLVVIAYQSGLVRAGSE